MDEQMLLAVPLLPLGAALILAAAASRFRPWLRYLAPAAAAASFGLLLALHASSPAWQAEWLRSAGLSFTVGLRLDGLAWYMALIVAGVGFSVSLYAAGYMAGARHQGRFFSTFAFFLGAMLALVLADSFLLLFAAWESVGLASFLLIGFHFCEPGAGAAALKAFLMTRAGDVALLLGWLWALRLVGSTDIGALLRAAADGTVPVAAVTGLAALFLAGALGKSAQLPLSAWLPDSMVGPAPVSALIHSATMVAAGVYLLLRLHPLFAAAPGVLAAMAALGFLTALTAALLAALQMDLKRLLAWSTVSNLGEMMLALGFGGPLAAAFHLGTHAAFKSSLFLAAGAVGAAAGTRDLEKLGNLAPKLPFAAAAFAAGALAMAGVPPFSGFWSADAILAGIAAAEPLFAGAMLLLLFLAALYIGRAGAAVFWRWPGAAEPRAFSPAPPMRWAMALLAPVAAGLGFFLAAPLETLLGLPPPPEIGWSWRAGAVAASLCGLGLGAGRVRRSGPVPALPSGFAVLETAVYALARAPATIALGAAAAIVRLERGFDGGAAALASAAVAFGRSAARAEKRLDALAAAAASAAAVFGRSAAHVEGRLDVLAAALAKAAAATAGAVDCAERRDFSGGVDRAAGWTLPAAARLAELQNGKIYWYTLGLFVWVLVAGAVGFAAWVPAG